MALPRAPWGIPAMGRGYTYVRLGMAPDASPVARSVASLWSSLGRAAQQGCGHSWALRRPPEGSGGQQEGPEGSDIYPHRLEGPALLCPQDIFEWDMDMIFLKIGMGPTPKGASDISEWDPNPIFCKSCNGGGPTKEIEIFE